MELKKTKAFIILSKPFYFGWLLAFPFYGPVFFRIAPFQDYKGIGLITIFMIFHFATYITAGFLLKNIYIWRKLMFFSALVSFLANLMLFLPFNFVWPLAMAITGICASLYILGWSVVYSLSGLIKERVGIMSLVIIGGNIVLLAFNILADLLPGDYLLAFLSASLLVAIIINFIDMKQNQSHIPNNCVKLPLPKKNILFLSLFTFIIYVNGGFAYKIMMPHFMDLDPLLSNYLPYLVYILVLVVAYRLKDRINRTFLVYCGVSFIGLAFVIFANIPNGIASYLITVTLMETAFAFIDLFVWISLNSLAYVHRAPFPIFGFVLSANILSILAGDIISTVNINLSKDIFTLIAMFSSTSVLIVILVIPWLLKSIQKSLETVVNTGSETDENSYGDLDCLMQLLSPNDGLTEREKSVLELVLLGLTNKNIAEELYLSENTIKTHLRKIYSKFGVSGKKELIYISSRKRILENQGP